MGSDSNKKVVPIRPGIHPSGGLSASENAAIESAFDDAFDDEFDEATVVEAGLGISAMFDSFEDEEDEPEPALPASSSDLPGLGPAPAREHSEVRAAAVVSPAPESAPAALEPPLEAANPAANALGSLSADELSPVANVAPAHGAHLTPPPGAYMTPPPGAYMTPPPGAYLTPAPGIQALPAPSQKNRTILIVVGAVVLVFAGIGVGSLLSGRDRGQPQVVVAPPVQPVAQPAVAPPVQPVAQPAVAPPVQPVAQPAVASTPPASGETPTTEPPSTPPDVPADKVPEMASAGLVDAGVAPSIPDAAAAPEATVPEGSASEETRKKPLKAQKSSVVSSPVSGKVKRVHVSKRKRFKEGAVLFTIATTKVSEPAKRKKLQARVQELEGMAKEDPIYEPFLAQARASLAKTQSTSTTKVTAPRGGKLATKIRAGQSVKAGQALGKIR